MAEENKTTPAEAPRPTGKVRWVELPQVLSAVAIGIMILPLFVTLDKGSEYGAWWILLIVVAVLGAIVPFFLVGERDKIEADAYYTVNKQRIATLREVAVPNDLVDALEGFGEFCDTGAVLRTKLYASVGEARGSEQIEKIYRYLRTEPPAKSEQPKANAEEQAGAQSGQKSETQSETSSVVPPSTPAADVGPPMDKVLSRTAGGPDS